MSNTSALETDDKHPYLQRIYKNHRLNVRGLHSVSEKFHDTITEVTTGHLYSEVSSHYDEMVTMETDIIIIITVIKLTSSHVHKTELSESTTVSALLRPDLSVRLFRVRVWTSVFGRSYVGTHQEEIKHLFCVVCVGVPDESPRVKHDINSRYNLV